MITPFVLFYFFCLNLFSFLIYRFYAKKIGINKITQFLQQKLKELDEKYTKKIIKVNDANAVLSVDLKRFEQLERKVEKLLSSLDNKIIALNQKEKQFLLQLNAFEKEKKNVNVYLVSTQNLIKDLQKNQDIPKQIQKDIEIAQQKTHQLTQEFSSMREDTLNHFQDDFKKMQAKMEENLASLQELSSQKGEVLEASFSEKIDEIENLDARLKDKLEERQDELLKESEEKLSKFFQEQSAMSREDIEKFRSQYQGSETKFLSMLKEVEDKQKLLILEHQSITEKTEEHKISIAQTIEDLSTTILDSFKTNVDNYQRDILEDIADRYDGMLQQSKDLEKHLNAKEDDIIHEVDDNFKLIQKSMDEYSNKLENQIGDINKEYDYIKGKLLKESQTSIEKLNKNIITLEANLNQTEKYNQVKTKEIDLLVEFIDKTKNKIEKGKTNFEHNLQSKNQQLENQLAQMKAKLLKDITYQGYQIIEIVKEDLKVKFNEKKIDFNKFDKFFLHMNNEVKKLKENFQQNITNEMGNFINYINNTKNNFTLDAIRLEIFDKLVEKIDVFKHNTNLEMKTITDQIKNITTVKEAALANFQLNLKKEIDSYKKSLQAIAKKQELKEEQLDNKNQNILEKMARHHEKTVLKKNKELQKHFNELNDLKKQLHQEKAVILHNNKDFLQSVMDNSQNILNQLEGYKEETSNFFEKSTLEYRHKLNNLLSELKEKNEIQIGKDIEQEIKKIGDTLQKINDAKEEISSLNVNYTIELNKKEREFQIKLDSLQQDSVEKIQTRFTQLDEKMNSLSTKVERFIKETDIFTKLDSLKEKIDQDLIKYHAQIEKTQQQFPSPDEINAQLTALKTSQNDLEDLLKKVHLEKKDFSLIEKNLKKLLKLEEDTQLKLDTIASVKDEMETFISNFDQYQEEISTIKDSFAKLSASQGDAKELFNQYHQLIETNDTLLQNQQNLSDATQQNNNKHQKITAYLQDLMSKTELLEENQEKLSEFNEKYDQLDIALQDVEQRKKSIEKMREDLGEEKNEIEQIKNHLDEQIKVSLKLLNRSSASQTKNKNQKSKHPHTSTEANEIKESVLSLHKIGWSKKDIAKHLKIDVYEVEVHIQSQHDDEK